MTKTAKVIRVTAHLNSAVVLSSELHLDGLLAAVHPGMHDRERPTRSGGNVAVPPLPLAQARLGDDWVWLASASEFPDVATIEGGTTLTRRRDPADVFHLARQYQPGSGSMKDRMVKAAKVLSPTVSWLACSNDVSEVERLLRRVKSVGGLRKSGYGSVAQWELEELETDWREVLALDGRARRRLPLGFGTGRPLSLIRSQPPYWHQLGLAPGYEVGAVCELSADVVMQ